MTVFRTIWARSRCAVLAEALEHRGAAIAIAAVGALQLVGSRFGVGMPCPFHQQLGIPCPGCGLTRSVMALMQGDVRGSMLWHPYGVLLAVALVAAGAAAMMPEGPRRRMLGAIGAFERKTGVTAVALYLLPVFWVVRLMGVLPLYAA